MRLNPQHPSDEDRWIEELQSRDWTSLRQLGLDRYLWRHHVRPVGLPVGIAIVLLNVVSALDRAGVSWQTVVIECWYLGVGSMLLAGVSGLGVWHHRERQQR